jgi:hypothetical protein
MNSDMNEKDTQEIEVVAPGEPWDETQDEADEELEEEEDRQE